MEKPPPGPKEDREADVACVDVNPGVCGFRCRVKVKRLDRRSAEIEIFGSECKQIQRLAKRLNKLSLRELFMPLTKNPVYVAAEASGCHPSCIIPAAVLKAAEAAMEMALPRPVEIRFISCQEEPEDG